MWSLEGDSMEKKDREIGTTGTTGTTWTTGAAGTEDGTGGKGQPLEDRALKEAARFMGGGSAEISGL